MILFRLAACLVLVSGLSGCGGGSSGADVSSSTNTLSFSAPTPQSATPAAQSFNVTLTTGTQYLVINHNGPAVSRINYTMNGATARVTVYPNSPATLGSGIFNSSIVITGYGCGDTSCSHLLPGNTDTVSANYTIPLQLQFVSPYVDTSYSGTAGNAQSLILRGQGFKAFAVQNVQFVPVAGADYSQASDITGGGTLAGSFSIINDTQIKTTYPASLSAGTYRIEVTTPGISAGTATTLAYLLIQDPVSYSATTLAYPGAGTTSVRRLIYDAERHALLVARNTGSGPEIDRYSYSSGWSTGSASTLSGLADIALTPNGHQLLSLTQTDITPLDPGNPSSTSGMPVALPALPTSDFYLGLAITNNDIGIVTTGYPSSAATPMYLYSIANGSFTQPTGTTSNPVPTPTLNNSIPAISGDGSLAVLAQGYSGSGASSIYTLSADTMYFETVSNQTINQFSTQAVVDRTGSTVVLNGTNVYTPSFIPGTPPVTRITLDFTLQGLFPNTTEAVALNQDASTAYTLDTSSSPPEILKYNLSLTPSAGAGSTYASSSATLLPADPGSGASMILSPDGKTLFIAGNNQIVIEPAP